MYQFWWQNLLNLKENSAISCKLFTFINVKSSYVNFYSRLILTFPAIVNVIMFRLMSVKIAEKLGMVPKLPDDIGRFSIKYILIYVCIFWKKNLSCKMAIMTLFLFYSIKFFVSELKILRIVFTSWNCQPWICSPTSSSCNRSCS